MAYEVHTKSTYSLMSTHSLKKVSYRKNPGGCCVVNAATSEHQHEIK